MGDRNAFEFVAVAQGIFAAFASVALAANAVHGNGQCGVGFSGNGAQRHRTRGKTLDDFFGRFDFVHRNGFGRINLEFEQTAQRQMTAALVVDEFGVFLVGVPVVGARAVLQLGNRIGCPHVLFAARTPRVFATRVQCMGQHRVGTEGCFVGTDGFFGDLKNADAFDPAGCAGKVLGHRLAGQADGLEQLRTAVAHVGAHAHLGHDLGQTLAHRLHIVVNRFVRAERTGQAFAHGRQGFHRQVGVHGFCAVARQHGKVVHFAGSAGFHHQTGGGAQALQHQVLVDGGQGQQRGYRNLLCVHRTVADDGAALDGIHSLSAQRRQFRFHALMAPGQWISDVQRVRTELAVGVALDVAQLGHVGKVEHRLRHFQAHRRVDLVDVQQVGLGTYKGHQAHHDRFADRIDRRVGDLREQLLEVVVQRFVFVRQHGQGAVVAHRAQGLFAIGRHRSNQELQVLLREPEGLLAVQQGGTRCARGISIARHVGGHVVELDAQVIDPLLVGFAIGQTRLEFLVVNHAALLQVDQEHLAGLQTPFAHDFVFRHGQHARLRTHDDQVIIGNAVARGAQTVAVQGGTDLTAIGKYDGSRAVPRLQHGGVVLVERAAALVHGRVVFPRFGNHHHHGLANRVAGHGQQFQTIVEGRGVGLVGEADGVELFQVRGQHG